MTSCEKTMINCRKMFFFCGFVMECSYRNVHNPMECGSILNQTKWKLCVIMVMEITAELQGQWFNGVSFPQSVAFMIQSQVSSQPLLWWKQSTWQAYLTSDINPQKTKSFMGIWAKYSRCTLTWQKNKCLGMYKHASFGKICHCMCNNTYT